MSAGRMAGLARRVGCTEGQLYTMVIALTLAVALAVAGIPAVLRDRSVAANTSAPGGGLQPFTSGSGSGESSGAARVEPTVPAVPPPDDLAPFVASAGPGRLPPAPIAPADGGVPPVASPPPVGRVREFARVAPPGAPAGIAVADDGSVHVATGNGTAHGVRGASHVLTYSRDGRLLADHAVGGQRPDHVEGLTGVAVGRGRGITVLDADGARVLEVDRETGATTVRAVIPDLLPCGVALGAFACQPGTTDRRPFPLGAAYDADGHLYVSDPPQDTVWRLRSGGGAAEVWFQSPYAAAGDGPAGLAWAGRALVVTVGRTLDPASFGGGALYRVDVGADGAASSPTLVTAFGARERPGALAVGRSGRAYTVLRGGGAIVGVDGTGRRSDVAAVRVEGSMGLALADGALLVTDGRTSADSRRWRVLAVAVDDGRVP